MAESAPDGISGCDDLLPCLESTLPFGLVVRSRKQMSFRSEVSCHDIVHFEKTLRMLRRLEALHPALSLPGRLMRVLCSIVEVPALPMSDSRQNYFLRSAIASKLVRNDHARPTSTALQQLPEEPHRSKTIPLGLHQNIDDGAVLIDGTPEIMLHSVDLQKHFVEEPFVAQLGPSPLQFGRIRRSERIAPAADRLVAQLDSSIRHHQFHFAQTDGKVEVQPYALRNDLLRKSITAIRIGWHLIRITSARREPGISLSSGKPGQLSLTPLQRANEVNGCATGLLVKVPIASLGRFIKAMFVKRRCAASAMGTPRDPTRSPVWPRSLKYVIRLVTRLRASQDWPNSVRLLGSNSGFE